MAETGTHNPPQNVVNKQKMGAAITSLEHPQTVQAFLYFPHFYISKLTPKLRLKNTHNPEVLNTRTNRNAWPSKSEELITEQF